MIKKKEDILTDDSQEETRYPKEVSDLTIRLEMKSSCLGLKDLTELADLVSDLLKLNYQVAKVESRLEVKQSVSKTLNSISVDLQDWHAAEAPF